MPDEIDLGNISLEYDEDNKLLQIVQCGEEVIGTAEFIQPEEWEEMCKRILTAKEAETFMALVLGDHFDPEHIDSAAPKCEAIAGRSWK